jgi:hypothetical protein
LFEKLSELGRASAQEGTSILVLVLRGLFVEQLGERLDLLPGADEPRGGGGVDFAAIVRIWRCT